MTVTSFWHPDGTRMSVQWFMQALFGRLPNFITDENERRALWITPDTRQKLLEGLAEKGFGKVFSGFQKYLYQATSNVLLDTDTPGTL